MLQAIDRLERALDRLEDIAAAARNPLSSPPAPDAASADEATRARAAAALQSLDSLIAELKAGG